MSLINSFKKRVANIGEENFEELTLDIFRFQAVNNPVYHAYLQHLNIDVSDVHSTTQIPFLPIEFFKTHEVKSGEWESKKTFMSSGTTGMIRSKHYLDEIEFYLENTRLIFESFYDSLATFRFFALLPSYQEQGNSSLITMVDYFMQEAKQDDGGYYLNNTQELTRQIRQSLDRKSKVALFGVGYALLDLCDNSRESLDGLLIIETGGMKGRREEMTKDEFYEIMRSELGEVTIHSEYGMTELLSQAYSDGQFFRPGRTMRVMIRDVNDPFSQLSDGRVGGVNVIDLANIHSCSFIETKDLGRSFPDGRFEILGRIDNSDIRGCNLLVV